MLTFLPPAKLFVFGEDKKQPRFFFVLAEFFSDAFPFFFPRPGPWGVTFHVAAARRQRCLSGLMKINRSPQFFPLPPPPPEIPGKNADKEETGRPPPSAGGALPGEKASQTDGRKSLKIQPESDLIYDVDM